MNPATSRSTRWASAAAWLAAISFATALAACGAALEGYSQLAHPVGLLGARGVPGALLFDAFGFVLPGLLAAAVALRLRAVVGDGAHWAARIGAHLALLSALAFAAQGLLPLDPRDLEATASRAHATVWTLWWVALLPAALLLALGLRGLRGARVFAAASVVVAALVAALSALPLDVLVPALAQRVAFATWLTWTIVAAGVRRPS